MRWRKKSMCALLAAISSSALAFKVDTHIWVAQEVINNLETCQKQTGSPCINIEVDGKTKHFPVRREVAEAILANEPYFRSGNIGPDAFPDIMVGQTIIHPGITESNIHLGFIESNQSDSKKKAEYATGFGTSDWLNLLRDRAEKITDADEKKKALAFVYGFMGHAAADVWAHTYVNTYSGDVFSLVDGETDVERRHIALEDYIAERTPRITNAKGERMGEAFQLIGTPEKLAIPEEFIRQNLIWDKEAQKQLTKVGTGQHLKIIVDLEQEIERSLKARGSQMSNTEYAKNIGKKFFDQYTMKTKSSKDIDDVFNYVTEQYKKDFSEAQGLEQFEVVAIQVLAYYYFNLELSTREAAKTAELMNALQKFQGDSIGSLAGRAEEMQKFGIGLSDAAFKLGLNISDQIVAANSKFVGASNVFKEVYRLDAIQNKRRGAMRALEQENGRLCKIVSPKHCESLERTRKEVTGETCKMIKGPCRWIPKGLGGRQACDPLEKCEDIFEMVTDRSAVTACFKTRSACEKTHNAANKKLREATNDFNAVNDELINFLANHQGYERDVANAYQDLRNLAVLSHELAQKAQKQVAALEHDLLSDISAMTQGHRGLIQVWSDDIKEAMRQWSIANGKAMRNAIDQDDKTGVMDPLLRWKELYFPSILGIKQQFLNQTVGRKIAIMDEYDRLWTKLEESARKTSPEIAGRILDARDRFKRAAPFVIADTLNKPFNLLFGTEKYGLSMTVHVAKDHVSRDRLNKLFAEDSSGRHLIKFGRKTGSIADRVDSDMKLVYGRKFDPKRFAPARNAVTFASLALLDQEGLRQLLGTDRYQASFGAAQLDSLLLGSLRSIDGNHQWLQLAPPYPRETTVDHDVRWLEAKADDKNVSRRFSKACEKANPALGFPLFRIEELKTSIFDQVFDGVMNEALFLAKEYGFEEVLPGDYQDEYIPTKNNPFPIPHLQENCL